MKNAIRNVQAFSSKNLSFKYTYVTGMHFSQSVSIIQSQVGVIRGVQVLYSDTVSTRYFILIYETYIHNTQIICINFMYKLIIFRMHE